MLSTRIFVGIAAGVLMSAGSASAHHPFSTAFDSSKRITLEGDAATSGDPSGAPLTVTLRSRDPRWAY